MQYRHFGKLDLKPSLLGFGVMRLPVFEGKSSQIDTNEAIRMIRHAIDAGVNYVDTAWIYHDGQSEVVTGQALLDGYREKVMLATKNPTWLLEKPEDFDYYLDEQLKKLQTNSIDFYLQHALDVNHWEMFKKLKLWDRAMEAKKAGKIKHFGFSFHDNDELFMEIIDSYDWDFCQIQFNYLDTDYQAGLKGLEKAASKNIGVIVMEPLRGGRLVTGLPKDLMDKMEAYPVKRKPVEWALRFITHFPGVSTILSGMSTFEQVEENIRLCSEPGMVAGCMSEQELAFIEGLAKEWKNKKLVGCTGCNYCMPCPAGIDIPGCFATYNHRYSAQVDAEGFARKNYKQFVTENKDASLCLSCGMCESACPQQLKIMETLKKLHTELA